jgi:hypothetical protein
MAVAREWWRIGKNGPTPERKGAASCGPGVRGGGGAAAGGALLSLLPCPPPASDSRPQTAAPTQGKARQCGGRGKKERAVVREGRLTLRSSPNSPRRVRPFPPLPCPLVRVSQPAHAPQGGGYALGGGASGGNGQVPPPCVPTLDPPNTDARPKRCGCMGDACVRGVGGGGSGPSKGGCVIIVIAGAVDRRHTNPVVFSLSLPSSLPMRLAAPPARPCRPRRPAPGPPTPRRSLAAPRADPPKRTSR